MKDKTDTGQRVPPYLNEEFEKLIPRAKTALAYFKKTKTSDKNYEEVRSRFVTFLEYMLATFEPIEEMRLIADKRHMQPFDPKAGDRKIENGKTYLYHASNGGEWIEEKEEGSKKD